MQRTVLAVLVLALGFAVHASAEVTTARHAKKVKLREASAFDDKKMVLVKVGERLEGELKLRIDDFFDKKCVYVSGEVKNPTKEPRHFQLYVAFYDKDGRLVCSAGEASFSDDGVKPGEVDQIQQCIMGLPHEAAASIKSYDIVLYEGDQQVGKE